MSHSKVNEFNKYSQYVSLVCKAFSHPARIYIVKEIIDNHGDEVDYTSLTSKIPLAKSTISQHIAYLRKMDILVPSSSKKDYYGINKKMFNTIMALLFLASNLHGTVPKSIINELKHLSRAK